MATGSERDGDGGAAPVSALARRTEYLPTLDGWRAIAIVLVVTLHVAPSLGHVLGPGFLPLERVISNHFAVGVDIFFGISGFLISSRLLLERAETGRVNLKSFYIRRVFRIQPPALVVLLVTALLAWAGIISVPWLSIVAALLFFQNYVGGPGYVNHFWSLSVEEHFYLFWPGLFRVLPVQRAAVVAGGLALLVAAWRFLAFKYQLGFGDTFWGRTDIRLDGLLWGCVVAIVYCDDRGYQLLERYLKPISAYALIAAFVLVAIGTRSGGYKTQLVALTLRSGVIPLMLCASVMNSGSLLGRLLESSPFKLVGRLSYSLYLWQQLFLVRESLRSPVLGELQGFPFGILCAIGCAWLSYRFIERPAIRFGHRLAGKKPVLPATVSPRVA